MTKSKKITYWVATIWLCLGMAATGYIQFSKAEAPGALAPPGVYGMTKLGYPTYLLTLIAICKFFGVVALLIPKFALLKEWAYAGFFFLMSGAVVSHIAVGHPISEIFPGFLLLSLTILSWYFRPDNRKVNFSN